MSPLEAVRAGGVGQGGLGVARGAATHHQVCRPRPGVLPHPCRLSNPPNAHMVQQERGGQGAVSDSHLP